MTLDSVAFCLTHGTSMVTIDSVLLFFYSQSFHETQKNIVSPFQKRVFFLLKKTPTLCGALKGAESWYTINLDTNDNVFLELWCRFRNQLYDFSTRTCLTLVILRKFCDVVFSFSHATWFKVKWDQRWHVNIFWSFLTLFCAENILGYGHGFFFFRVFFNGISYSHLVIKALLKGHILHPRDPPWPRYFRGFNFSF